MNQFIVRIVKILLRLGVLRDVYKITYQGKGVSLNEFYTQGHWTRRTKVKDKYKTIFTELIENSKLEWMDQFSLLLFYNSRHDPDNVIGMEKVFVDTLKGDYIQDDNKKFYRGIYILPDDTLPANTFEFYLLAHGNNEKRDSGRHSPSADPGQTFLRF